MYTTIAYFILRVSLVKSSSLLYLGKDLGDGVASGLIRSGVFHCFLHFTVDVPTWSVFFPLHLFHWSLKSFIMNNLILLFSALVKPSDS